MSHQIIFVDPIVSFWGGPIVFQGNWQHQAFHGYPILNYRYRRLDGCSYQGSYYEPTRKVGCGSLNYNPKP